ncbi:MAG: SH3 domain-containing protein [Anaerolineae bacterium]|nr:SH3 domain-containing protein [Anaerolineae bacterium]
MRRFWLCLMFALVTLTAAGQAAPWQAWLYDPANGSLALVDGTGGILGQATLPLPAGYDFYPYEVAIAASGRRVAYILSSAEAQELIVYDPRPGFRDVRLRYPLPPLFAEGMGLEGDDSYLFNAGDTALAIGYSLREGGWHIPIIDLNSGLATLILRGGAGPAAELPAATGITPVIRFFDGGQVVFTLVQAGDLGQPGAERGSYTWDISAGRVTATPAYASLDSDTFGPTGETVSVATDADGSRLMIATGPAVAPQPLLAAPEQRLFFPRFVQNGAALLVGAYDADGRPSFRLIGRDGQVYGTWATGAAAIIGSLRGTATGFAYTVDSISADETRGTDLYTVDLAAALDAGERLFSAPVNTRPRIVWLQDSSLSAGEYVPWRFIGQVAAQPTATPAAAVAGDGSAWQAWIYQDDGLAIRIDQDGTALDVDEIPLSSPPAAPPARLTASADGTLLAYVLRVADTARLYVYHTRRDTLLLSYRVPVAASTALAHTIERAPQANLFTEAATALAFGYGTGDGWQIDLIDLADGTATASLRHDSPAMLALNTATAFGTVPVIQKVAGGRVHFTVQPPGALLPPYASFVWDTSADTVNPTAIYASPQTDTWAPTGEVIMSLRDERLPSIDDRFLYGQLNALHVYDPATNTRYPFYVSPQLWLYRPLFIQNGERLLSGGVDPSGAFIGQVVLERDGEQAGLLPLADDVLDAAGTGDGFIYLPQDVARVRVQYVNTRQALDAGVEVWSIERTGRPQLVWAGYAARPAVYRPWRVLALPVSGGAATDAAVSAAGLAVDGAARIRPPATAALFLHVTPSRTASILTRLNSGIEVTLLEGPVRVGGAAWWRVRTPGGVEGWVIEAVDGQPVLLPR